VVQQSASRFFALAAGTPQRQIAPALPTSSRETRVRSFCPPPPGRLSRRGRRALAIATGSRACAYKTASGRSKWLSRDPTEERAGAMLYAFLRNRTTASIDRLGLSDCVTVGYGGTMGTVCAKIKPSGDRICASKEVIVTVVYDWGQDETNTMYKERTKFYCGAQPAEAEWHNSEITVRCRTPIAFCTSGSGTIEIRGEDYSHKLDDPKAELVAQLTASLSWSYDCNACCEAEHPMTHTVEWKAEGPMTVGKE